MNKRSVLLSIVTVISFVLALAFGGNAGEKAQPKKAAPKEQPKAAAPREEPKMGGTLIFGLGKEFANPNPFVQTSSVFQFVKETCYESLLTSTDDGRIVPHLAAAYEVSAGGTAVTVRLRKGIAFHNGTEMKADDVIWSANHVKNPKNGAFGNNMITDVKSVEKIDDYNVRINLFKPSVTILAYLSNIQMLPIVPANSLKPGQIKLEKNVFVPGTGPFIFEQYQLGFDTVVKKFPGYWGGPAFLDKVIFRAITDNANRFNALRTGDVQMADRLSPLDAVRVRKGDVKGIRILEEPLGGYSHLMFNYNNPLFQKLEMRQALLYATDKQRLVDEIFFGAAKTADIEIDPEGVWGKAANLPSHKRDVAKTKALLKAAGYKGQELVWIGRKQEAQFAESFQRMLGEAGINVKVEILESGVMKERFREGKFDLYVGGATIFDEPVITMVPDYYTNKVNKGSYSNPKVDQLIDILSAEFDHKKRLQIFKDLAWTLYNDVADIPLLFETRYVGMVEKVQGYGPPQGVSYSESGEYFKHVWLK